MAANFSAMAFGIFSGMLTEALSGIDIFTDHPAETKLSAPPLFFWGGIAGPGDPKLRGCLFGGEPGLVTGRNRLFVA